MTIEELQQRDPRFDETAFLGRADAVRSLVVRARGEAKPELARAVLGEDMATRLATEAAQRTAARRRQVEDGVKVRSSEIVSAEADGAWETIAVRFGLEGASYEAHEDGKPAPGSSVKRRTWSEDWWFQRPVGTTTDQASDAPIDRCASCGAPLAPTAEGRCAYCQKHLADPRAWSLTRISEVSLPPPSDPWATMVAGGSGITIGHPAAYPGAVVASGGRAGRLVGLAITLVVLAVVGFIVFTAVHATTKAAKDITAAVTSPTFVIPEVPGVSLPSIPGAKVVPTTTPGFVTPVANPRVKAPINDVAGAAAAVQAKVGKPLVVDSIHLYPDGRIIFEVQAPDDPMSVDSWVWKGGTVTGPEQGGSSIKVDRFYPVGGIDFAKLAGLCDNALGATGIADGVIDGPYLLKIGAGLRWYIPVHSQSRSGNQKTYQVGPDGKSPVVF